MNGDSVTYYDYDGMPAYRRGNDIKVITHAGKARDVTELVDFAHKASRVSKERYKALKRAVLGKT